MAQTYRECEYINIQGSNAYFDTGHKITQNTRCVAQFMTLNGSSSYAWGSWLGNANDDNVNTWRLRWLGGDGVFQVNLPNNTTVKSSAKSANVIYNVEFGNLYFKDLDSGEEVTGTSVTFEDRTYNFLIGNNINKSSYSTNANYYSVKLYEGDTLIGDYVPCLDSSSKVAFYDKVSDSFIYSNGGGSITYKLIPVTKKYDFLGDNVVLLPSHILNPEISVFYSSNVAKSIPFTFDTATTTNLHIRCKIQPHTITNGNETVGFGYKVDTNDWRFFTCNQNSGYLDIGSNRAELSKYGYSCGKIEVEIGNNYIKDLTTGEYTYSGEQQSVTYEITDGKGHFDIGALYVFYAQVLDDNDNLLLDLIPKQNSNGKACLYDKLTDTYYGADWGMTYGEQGTTVNNWKSASSIDFGGTNVTFSGTMANWSANTTISAVTNGSILNSDGRSLFKSDTALTTFECDLTNLEQGGDGGANGMFEFDKNLISFNPTSLQNLVNGHSFLEGCSVLPSFTTDCPSLLTATSMFWEDYKLKDVNANFSALTSGQTMFGKCTALTSFTSDLSSLQTASGMFVSCNTLPSFTTELPNLTFANWMFSACTSLKDFNVALPKVVSAQSMFEGCTSLTGVNTNLDSLVLGYATFANTRIKNWNLDLPKMVSGMSFLRGDLTLNSFSGNCPNLTSGNTMFSGDTALTTASLGETTKLNSNLNMFLNCTALTSCSMSLSSITGWNGMFSGCNNLVDWHIKDLGIECSTLLKTGVTSIDYIADNAKSVSNGEWFVMTDEQYANNSDAVATLQGKGWTVYKESNYPQDRTEGTNQILMSNGSFSLCGKTYSNNLEGVNKWVTLPDSASTWTNLNNTMNNNQAIQKVYVDFGGLTQASGMCSRCHSLTEFSGDLSSLQIGGANYPESGTFYECYSMTSFTTTNLNSLTRATAMFRGTNIKRFAYDMPNVQYVEWMFQANRANELLEEFISDMPKATNIGGLVAGEKHLHLFRASLPSVTSTVHYNVYPFYNCSALTDFQVWQLPISSSVTFDLTSCPINYDSFVYMALNNQEVSAISSDQHLSGCTLNLSTTSKNLSATTDVTKYWNLLEKKGYKISGYTADIEDLPTFVEVRDDATVFDGEGSSDSGSPLVVALTHSLSSTTITGSVSDGYIQLNNYTNNEIDVVIGSQTYQIGANTNSDVIEIKSGKQLTFTSDSEVSYTKVDDTENNTTTITF